jgi:hypothetical protein
LEKEGSEHDLRLVILELVALGEEGEAALRKEGSALGAVSIKRLWVGDLDLATERGEVVGWLVVGCWLATLGDLSAKRSEAGLEFSELLTKLGVVLVRGGEPLLEARDVGVGCGFGGHGWWRSVSQVDLEKHTILLGRAARDGAWTTREVWRRRGGGEDDGEIEV